MPLNKIGFIGWRGMVGSVLMQRMRAEDDFALIAEPRFFSTSQVGQAGPDVGDGVRPLADAYDLAQLAEMDAVVTCQGGDYTQAVHADLRARGWNGYWIDAASTLRLAADSCIVLDPVNRAVIDRALTAGCKDFIGGNCTVSLMLMALSGWLRAGLVEWISVATYQAVSGAGARAMRELLLQMRCADAAAAALVDSGDSILAVEEKVREAMRSDALPTEAIGAPLAGSLLPWIDSDSGCGVSREEAKGAAETNKVLACDGSSDAAPIAVESVCIRVGVMRCHSQAFTVKLREDLSLDAAAKMLAEGNDWVRLVANERDASLRALTPAAVTGTLDIAVGRLRKLGVGAGMFSVFSVGDQLLWGAAEPLRRMLRILIEREQ